MNPVQHGLTSVNRREPAFSQGNSHYVFFIYPADLPRKFQQYFKFDRPSSLIQQLKPPGDKFTLAQGLVTCAQAIGRGTSHNLRRVFFFCFFFFIFIFFFCIMFPPLENGQIAQ